MTLSIVGQPYLPDGNAPDQQRLTKDGALVVSQLHGTYLEDVRRGNLWTWSSGAAGVTVLKYDNTTPAFGLWNKSTAYALEVVQFTLAWAGTPAVAGNIGFGLVPAAGYTLGVPISAFTELATAMNSRTWTLGGPPNGRCATTLTIVALAAAAYIPIFSFPDALAAASTTVGPFDLCRDFRGTMIVPPGAAIILTGSVAQTAAMGATISWIDNVVY